ncbi:membrane-associated proteins in eicosanoid and glutathione metabolism [Clathrospora elynae]|uniref:Membrane-associated proteins in eicosanoid and glutathione metabolism n=1 Tax=Clathrospora elynae TaxID=706981 RepID=A0A6A5S6U3_9PLEO|nr:membrane-associated proteins in eicosanoid and glutathione metabolism [Clathrospora elynae]
MATLTTIQVPQEYGYVLITAASSYVLSIWLGVRIGPFRRAAKVPYPNTYASSETIANASSAREKRALYLFNCAQRAHHNALENYSTVLTGMLITGLKYPKIAAAMGAVWIFGRVIYATSYTSTSENNVDGRGRFGGGGFYLSALSQIVLLVLVGKIGVDLLRL